MIIFVRHGERADRVSNYDLNKIEINFDAQLTDYGVEQSRKTGRCIQNLITDYSRSIDAKPKVILLSSPLLRALMTADAIKKELSDVYENSVFTQDAIFEVMKKYDRDVRQDIYLRAKTEEDHRKYFKCKVREGFFPENETQLPVFPEDEEKCIKRGAAFCEYLWNQLNSGKYGVREHIFVIVTHQIIVEAAQAYFGAPVAEPKVCSIFQVMHKTPLVSRDVDVLLNADTSHLLPLSLIHI
eukprot:TRINITY_DN9318_c0_g1_i1.p1 TRINITY_DN9318_c0_g1~~TRINITY_DN9318_c0_g1_i1.p1  ORF type:complete len:241 (+),score=29.05 TRINITY_DN9318_c0_g1_i1:142-864(+)